MWRPFFISNTKHDHGEILWDNIAPYWPIMEKASNGARHCPSGGNFLMRSNISLNSYVMARHNSNKTKDPLVSRTRDSRKKQGKTMKTKEYHGQPRKGGGVPWTWRRRRWSKSRTGLVVGFRVWRIYSNIRIFEYSNILVTNIYSDIRSYQFFSYEYIRTFVRVKFFCTNIFGHSLVSMLECKN